MNQFLVKQLWMLGLCLLALSWDARATTTLGEWEKISDDDGIEVFKKEIPNSPIVAFKGQGVINAPILKVISVLTDIPRGVEWIDSLEDTLLLKKESETSYVTYNHIGTPIVMKDRDFVIRTTVETKPDRSVVFKMKSADDPAAPQSSYVRGEIMDSSYVLTPQDQDKKTYVTTEIHADPKGSTAKWIVNLFQKKWPRHTLESLRKQVAKPDIPENKYFKQLLNKDKVDPGSDR